jgi:hypothetical protein
MTLNPNIVIQVTLTGIPAACALVWIVARHLMGKRKPGPSNHVAPDTEPRGVDALSESLKVDGLAPPRRKFDALANPPPSKPSRP